MNADRQTARSVKVTESSYRALVEQVRDYAIFLIDPAGWIRSWNEGARRVFGHTRDEFVGLHTSALFVPEDIAAGIPARELETARTEGEANDDRWLMRKDGTRFWANGATTSLRDAQGDVIGFAKIVHDRTGQKRTEEALRESEQRLTAALHAAQMGTWRWDIATDVYTFDASLHALFGLPPDEEIRSIGDFLEHLHPEDRSSVVTAFQRSVNEGADFNVEFRVPLPDGGMRWLRDQGQVVRDPDGQVESLTGACVDITERRRTEERVRHAQRMEAVGQLAGGVAHEINNMMQGVLGFSELLLHGLPTDDERRGDVEQIRRAAGRAAIRGAAARRARPARRGAPPRGGSLPRRPLLERRVRVSRAPRARHRGAEAGAARPPVGVAVCRPFPLRRPARGRRRGHRHRAAALIAQVKRGAL
jgi:PAS domain S-box-containing protein